MGLVVNSNMAAFGTFKSLASTSRGLSKTFEHLSTGLRVAKAADDAAGSAVADNLKAQWTSGQVAGRNINDALSLLDVADGAAKTINNTLIRMRELAVQSASGSLEATERAYLQTEFLSLQSEIDRVANSAEFNGIETINASAAVVTFHVGTGDTTEDQISISFVSLLGADLGVDAAALTLTDATVSAAAISTIDAAMDLVNNHRAVIGSTQNRLTSALENIEVYTEAMKSAESRIRDADFGWESAELSRFQVLQQAGMAVLAQAKSMPQSVLQLLQ